ncbi:MAG: OmpA family protein [Candidatus Latescibacteria bacterium]|nr:OmpA family protein [Candidatus Latescibacterota bacterium]
MTPAPGTRHPRWPGICKGWALLLGWLLLLAATPHPQEHGAPADTTHAGSPRAAKTRGHLAKDSTAANTAKAPADSALVPLPRSRARAEAEPDTIPPKRPVNRYRIVQPYVPASATERQVAISRGRSKANLGSRDGVQAGSIFSAVNGGLVIGLVQVDSIGHDTSWVRLIKLENVLDPRQPYPLDRSCELQPKLVTLETVHFEGETPLISQALEDRLAHMASFISAFPEAPVLIEGHSDSGGKKGQAMALSLQRAERIKTYLHEYYHLPKARMYTRGYGDTRPLAANASETGRRQNRRVEILLVDKVPAPPDTAAAKPAGKKKKP